MKCPKSGCEGILINRYDEEGEWIEAECPLCGHLID